jgi:hypothetical protein
MNVLIQPLRHPDGLHQALCDDGWTLETERNGVFYAEHPQVADEVAARNRLYHLGLLTSSSLRIEFPWRQEKRLAR